MDTLNLALAFADAHPLLCWLATTALLNAAARGWPWLSQTPPGRVFATICAYLGADALGLLKAGAAASGAKALHVAAGASASPTSLPPPSLSPPAVTVTGLPAGQEAAPPTPRNDIPPGESGRRS